jgi:molybdopterin/thiamine biosynthesis adenylyltransferase
MGERKYKLINVSKIVKYENKILLIDDEIIEIEPYNKKIYRALKKLQRGCTKEEILEIFELEKESDEFFKQLEFSELLSEYGENLLHDTLIEKQWYYLEGLSKESPCELQRRISSKTVCIVGAGGVGSVVIDHIVRAGVKKLIIIDFDVVHRSNLNRQMLFNEEDIGLNKVECIYKKVKKIDETISIQSIMLRISSIEDMDILKEYPIDILVNAADTPFNIENIIHEFGRKNNIVTISCSVGRNYGSWGPLFVPNDTVCYQCYNKYEEQHMSECEKYISSLNMEPMEVSFGPINTIVSTLMAKDLIIFLAIGSNERKIPSLNARCGIDFMNLEFSRDVIETVRCACR